MTAAELRAIVKQAIIAQGGNLYGFNFTNWIKAYGVSGTQIQNAINYFQCSPQQEKFRATYNFH